MRIFLSIVSVSFNHDESLLSTSSSITTVPEFPVISINLSGDYTIEELKFYAENLQDELESISSVSKALIEGVNEREIKINVDMVKLEA